MNTDSSVLAKRLKILIGIFIILQQLSYSAFYYVNLKKNRIICTRTRLLSSLLRKPLKNVRLDK